MKNAKKVLSVFLALLMLACLCSVSFSAYAEGYLKNVRIDFSFREPRIGFDDQHTQGEFIEALKNLEVTVVTQHVLLKGGPVLMIHDDAYSINMARNTAGEWYEAGPDGMLDLYKTYGLRFEVATDPEYDPELTLFDPLTVWWNGQEEVVAAVEFIKDEGGANVGAYITIPIGAPEYTYPAFTGCHWCGQTHGDDFIGKLTAWFHNLLVTFFGSKY
ncbi:MAG: hypothetical protein IJS90_04795 [Clostridia bacterium]|nr:hypothetical protein [Clostridia bacterium]